MLSTFALGPAAVLPPPRPAAVSAIQTLPLAASSQAPSLAAPSEAPTLLDEVLECRVRGYFPFPGGPRGPFAWLFRDTHQAISVFGTGPERLHMDFMTAGGGAHPVWWDEGVKWQVLLGGSIRGEVRVRGAAATPGSKLARLREVAESYDTDMNLCILRAFEPQSTAEPPAHASCPPSRYTNNCRIFCARMRREAARINAEDLAQEDAAWSAMVADARLAVALLRASTLPMLYPGGVLFVCWEGVRDL